MKAWAPSPKNNGFTIVELLIVIVVIAILAAITIVAYNGIQNRAKDTSLQSAASQVGKKILASGPTNSDLFPVESTFESPANLTSSGLNIPPASAANTYDYYTSDDRKAFCLSVTNTTASPATSYAFTQNGQSVQGRCVKNLVTNPSVEGSITSYGGSCVTPSLSTDWKQNGVSSLRQVPNSTTTADCSSPVGGDTGGLRLSMQPGRTYRVSGTVRIPAVQSASSAARTIRGYHRTATVSYVSVSSAQAPNVIGSARVNVQLTLPNDATEAFIRLYSGQMSGGGDSYWDSIMLTEGADLYSYGDGDSANWSWAGTPNASASFGPAQLQ